jgi:hypothetical protein
MGNTFSVEVWGAHWGPEEPRSYLQVYGGESLIAALWALIKYKRLGYGCVTLHWRG